MFAPASQALHPCAGLHNDWVMEQSLDQACTTLLAAWHDLSGLVPFSCSTVIDTMLTSLRNHYLSQR